MRNSWLPPQWNGRQRIAHPVNWARLPEYDIGVAFVQTKVDHGHENRWYLYIRKFNEADVKAFPVLASTVITSSPGSTQTITSDPTWNNASNTIECIGAGARGAIGSGTSTSGGGGGGGGYTRQANNVIPTPGTDQYFARVGGVTGTNGSAGGDTWWTLTSPGTSFPVSGTAVGAHGAPALASATTATGGGGASTSAVYPGVPTAKSGGGAGGNGSGVSAAGGGGGGGAGGFSGDGTSVAGTGPTAGAAGNANTAGGGTGGGVGSPGVAGGAGTNIQTGPNAGSGGGGGGGNASPSTGGAGGLYGGGGGGGGRSTGVGGQGAQGVIVLTWTPLYFGTLVTTEAADVVVFTGSNVLQAAIQAQDGTPYELLLHFDGANASTTIVDSGGKNKTVTTHGTAQIDTSQLVFSNSALKLATSGDYLDVNVTASIVGTGDFTIDFRARLSSGSTAQTFYDGGAGNFKIFYDGTNLKFTSAAGTITGTALASNTNYHIAVTRAAGSTRLFKDGVQQGSTLSDATFYVGPFGYPQIGDGVAVVSGTLVTTEASDTPVFTGTAAFPAVTGTLVTTEAVDTAAFTGSVSAGMDAATTAWIAAVVSAGGSVSSGRQTVVDNLIVGLKTDGIYSKLDRLFLFAAENSQSALIDLVKAGASSSAATAVNSPTFTTNMGYQKVSNSTSYIDSNFNPTVGTNNFVQNSASIFAWNNTVGNDSGALFGSASSEPTRLFPELSGACYWNINSGALTKSGLSVTGLYTLTRPDADNEYNYINGALFDSYFGVGTSIAPANVSFRGLHSLSGYSSRQISCLGMSSKLSSTEQGNLYNRIAAYIAPTLWVGAVVAAGGSVSAGRETLVRALVAGLIADGIWQKLDRLWIFAAENTQSALIDLVTQDLATATNSPTFTTNRGYAGNGSSSYLDTTYNPSTQGVNLLQDSASAGVWDVTSSASSATASVLGAFDNSVMAVDLTMQYIDGNTYARINEGVAGSEAAAYAGSGAYIVNRSGASAAQIYRNGSSFATASGASSTVPNLSVFVCARNTVGSPGNYSPDQVAACLFGGSLTSTQQGNLYTRLRTFMTAIGVP